MRARADLLVSLAPTSNGYDTREKITRFYEALFERIRVTPGVRGVGAASSVPLHGSSTAGLYIEGGPMPNGPLPSIGYTAVSDDYFRTLGIPLRAGRDFAAQDAPGVQPRAVVVNDEAVRRFWAGRDPIGSRVRLGPDPQDPFYLVVGVVGNVRQDGFDAAPRPIAYTSYRQEGESCLSLAIKTDAPMRAVPVVRAAVHELDRSLPLTRITTMDDVAGNSLSRRRFSMFLLATFALVSLVLAVVGTYGVMAYTVSARTPELGVRIALGATTRNVLGLVVGQSMLTSTLGILIGVAAAAALTRTIRGMLYGIAPTDITTFLAVAATLLAACLLAAYVPGRRATRIDPVEALRRD